MKRKGRSVERHPPGKRHKSSGHARSHRQCGHCGGAHYISTCPALAQQLLKHFHKTSDVKGIAKALKDGNALFVPGLSKKGGSRKARKRSSFIVKGKCAFTKKQNRDEFRAKARCTKKQKRERAKRCEKRRQQIMPKRDPQRVAASNKGLKQCWKRVCKVGYFWHPRHCPDCKVGRLIVPKVKEQKARSEAGILHLKCTKCKHRFNATRFCRLRKFGPSRFPLPFIEKCMQTYCRSTKMPTVSQIASEVGLHRRSDFLHTLVKGMRHAEAQAGQQIQKKQKFKGKLEMDATGLRSMSVRVKTGRNKGKFRTRRMTKHLQIFGVVQRAAADEVSTKFNLYFLKECIVAKGAVPPVESLERVKACGALKCVEVPNRIRKDRPSNKLITDGARLYPEIARLIDASHHFVPHNKGQFARRDGHLSVHSGTIDNIWRMAKSAVPRNVATSLDKQTFNPALKEYIHAWHFRYCNQPRGYEALGAFLRCS